MILATIINVNSTQIDAILTYEPPQEVEEVAIASVEEPEWETWELTAYTDAPEENGGWTVTSQGTDFIDNYTLACPRELPYGTKIEIEGLGVRSCEDIGGNIKGKRIDVFIRDADEMQRFGRQERNVRILNEEETVE